MILSSNMCLYINQAVNNLNYLVGISRQTILPGKANLWAQEYYCWLHNAIVADYETITFLLKNMPDINQFDLRPIYCILRSTLEKYADVINLFYYGKPYEDYLWYLTFRSQEDHTRKAEYKKSAKNGLRLSNCHRGTRYELIDRGESLHHVLQMVPHISIIGKNLKELDSKYSRILHNNVVTNTVPRDKEVEELLKYLHCMMYTSTVLFSQYYRLDPAAISNALNNLYSALQLIPNYCLQH